MKIYHLCLFPDEIKGFMEKGLIKKGLDSSLFELNYIQLRDYSKDKRNTVDEYPYGNRNGMLLKADVLYDALSQVPSYEDYPILYPCPKGQVVTQGNIEGWSQSGGLIFVSGYYEGIDERLFDLFKIKRFSIGPFVLSSGDLPIMAVTDAVLRLVPGVIGNQTCIDEDSFSSGLLEYPQYTSPREFKGMSVPDVLLDGHHGERKKWQRKMALSETLFKRPSLLVDYDLTESDQHDIVGILKE
jgi:tRNA (guanine37-N1)-methyltransferase